MQSNELFLRVEVEKEDEEAMKQAEEHCYEDHITSTMLLDRCVPTDTLTAIILLANMTPTCAHCGETKTPQWRKGMVSTYLGKKHYLCNACGLKYNKQRYCYSCGTYYKYAMNMNSKCKTCGQNIHHREYERGHVVLQN